MSRRSFFGVACASALASGAGLFDFAATLSAEETKPSGKPRIRAAFLHPKVDKYWLGWPGAAYDIGGHQKLYTDALRAAAGKEGIELEILDEPLCDAASTTAFIDRLKTNPPDGLLLTIMDLNTSWDKVNTIAKSKENIPTIVFSPMGTSFTGHLQETRNIPGVFVAATQDVGFLDEGLHMLQVNWKMKNTRLCIVQQDKNEEKTLDIIGTTLHYIPAVRFTDEVKKTEDSAEVRAIAAYYTKEARKIVEPGSGDILNAVRNYIAARRLLEQERCQGFSIECLGPVGKRTIQPPCLALSRLNDEGKVGACEGDWNAAITMLLSHLRLSRPGFMQDPAPNTVNNTLMGAHCSCPTRLNGYTHPHEPFILRSHSESNIGVSLQVLWKAGQKITLASFSGPDTLLLGTGTVIRNIDTPPSGGCRTSVEVTMDGVADTLDAKGFHQLFIYGDHALPLRNYCKLAGIKCVPI